MLEGIGEGCHYILGEQLMLPKSQVRAWFHLRPTDVKAR
jgi:hypothetical protein